MQFVLKMVSAVCICVIYFTIGYHACGVFEGVSDYYVGAIAGLATFGTWDIINALIGD